MDKSSYSKSGWNKQNKSHMFAKISFFLREYKSKIEYLGHNPILYNFSVVIEFVGHICIFYNKIFKLVTKNMSFSVI